MTAALWPTSGGSPEKFVIRAKASSPSPPLNQRSRSQLWAPHDAQAVCWCGSSFHSSPRAARSHQPTSAPVTWIIRTSPMAPSSISRLAATGASRKRCCETTDRRTPASRQAATISAHSAADWAIGFSTRRCSSGLRRLERLGEMAGGRRGQDHDVDVVARQQRARGPARAGCRSRPPAPSRAARRSRRLSVVPVAWLAATSDHVRPMNPEPTTPTRTVMRPCAGCAVEEVDPGRPAVVDELVQALVGVVEPRDPGRAAGRTRARCQAASSSARVPTLATRSGSW